jgi:putative GTP pyrophosphokinase
VPGKARIWGKGDVFPHGAAKINRVGKRIRRAVEEGHRPADADLAFLDLYRSCHYPGLRELHERLARFLYREVALDPEYVTLTARPLKTPDAIIRKLVREKSRLSTVQDIAGTRVVVSNPAFQEAVKQAILARFAGLQPRIAKRPEEADVSGYRALHIVVTTMQQGAGTRSAEIQVRTVIQEKWAQVVESLDERRGWDLKHGQGPAEAQEWLDWLIVCSELGFKAEKGEAGGATLPAPPQT